MEYEARFRRFVSIGDVSILSERVFGSFRVKHLLYFFISIIFLWRGMQGSLQLLLMGFMIGFLGLLSALVARGSMSLESRIVTVFVSLMDQSSRPRRKVEAQ